MIAQVPRISSPWKWKFRFYTMSGSVFYRCFWHEMRLAGLLDKSEKFSILSLAIARYLWWSETRLKKSFPSREWMIWMLKTLNQWSLGVPRFLSRHPHWFIMHWLRHLKKVGKIISTSWISRSIQFRGTKSVSKRDSRFSGYCCGWGNLCVEFKNIFAENKHEYMKGTSNIISVRYDTSRKDVLRNSGIDTSNEKCRISCKNGRRDRSFFVMFFRVRVIHTVLFIICQRRWQLHCLSSQSPLTLSQHHTNSMPSLVKSTTEISSDIHRWKKCRPMLNSEKSWLLFGHIPMYWSEIASSKCSKSSYDWILQARLGASTLTVVLVHSAHPPPGKKKAR